MMRAYVLVVVALAACGGGSDDTKDLAVSPISGQSCSADADCAAPTSKCVYKISDGCSAIGICAAPPSGTTCGAITELCGCNGGLVTAGCAFPSGYASGPTTGASSCVGDF